MLLCEDCPELRETLAIVLGRDSMGFNSNGGLWRSAFSSHGPGGLTDFLSSSGRAALQCGMEGPQAEAAAAS